jgi:hypothetical protein
MKTTRYIYFSDRVFAVGDLMRFANILDLQVPDASSDRTEYSVRFDDGHNIEGRAAEVFAEEQLNRPCRPTVIEIRLWLYSSGSYIHIQLRSGEPLYKYENSITISGNDANWVNANYTELHDAVDKVTPQSLWWRENRVRRVLLLNLIALGVGTLVCAALTTIALIIIGIWHNLSSRVFDPIPFSLFGKLFGLPHSPSPWLWRWVVGLPLAFLIRGWLFSMWPSIEFNFGSEYLRLDNRRKKLNWTLTVIIIPIIIAVVLQMIF